ncbi:MAG: DUF1554 domain-containing protein [Burkholderiales bacterium]|nr:DUF1554 domain-containing protein [Burkholderiales bacterium]
MISKLKLGKINSAIGFTLMLLSIASLSSCGSGSCLPNVPDGELKLKMEAPAQYPAGIAVDAYLTITNTSQVNATNLAYMIPAPGANGNYTGVTIVPNAGVGSSSGSCTNIAAGASCTFIAHIPANSHPGSFTVTAIPNATNGLMSEILNKITSSQISVTANIGLVNTPDFNTPYYILPGNQTITSISSEPTVTYVSLFIKTSDANLNNLELVDQTGTSLNYSIVGAESFTSNAVNTYRVVIPAGQSVQNIFAKSNTCSADCSNNAVVNLVSSNLGILSIEPNYFIMDEHYLSQTLTIQNIGAGEVSAITLPVLSNFFKIEDSNCGGSLAPNAMCTFKVIYTSESSSSGQESLVINYNNGSQLSNASAIIPYIGLLPLSVSIDKTPIAGESAGYCSVVTATVPDNVSVNTIVTLSVLPESTTSYGFTGTAPFLSTTTCTILAGENSCSTKAEDTNNLCASVNTVGTSIAIKASTAGYASDIFNTVVGGTIFYKTRDTNIGFNANLKSYAETLSGGEIANGVVAADYLCNNGYGVPTNGARYKALISIDGIRNVGTNGNQNLDWMLKPNTRYIRVSDSVTIATASESAVFNFPLESGFISLPKTFLAPAAYIWTGMNSDWTPNGDNCAGFTSSVSATVPQGRIFNSSDGGVFTNSQVIYLFNPDIAIRNCATAQGSSNINGLICVQQ